MSYLNSTIIPPSIQQSPHENAVDRAEILFHAACGTFLFVGLVMVTRGFDRRFEAEFTPWTRAGRTPVQGSRRNPDAPQRGNLCDQGAGTPLVLDAPREFFANGPYRVVRNPLYIGSTVFLLGIGLYPRAVSILLLASGWAIFVHLFVVYLEEPDLKRKFGATYQAYCAALPRWIPRVGRPKRTQ